MMQRTRPIFLKGIADGEWNVEPHLFNEEVKPFDLEYICGGSNGYENGMV